MPFDPNIIREDDANFEGDLKLPDDLALMAEQLGDDAVRLAAAYPPPVPAVLAAVSHQEKATQTRRTSWLTRSLAGTAIAEPAQDDERLGPRLRRGRLRGGGRRGAGDTRVCDNDHRQGDQASVHRAQSSRIGH